MSKYFGFKPNEGYNRVIDFKTIRSDIDTQLNNITKEKEEKREEIRKATNDLATQLEDRSGFGAHDELNRGLHDIADQIKFNKLYMYEQAKAGQVNWSTYNKYSQDTKAGLASVQTMMAALQTRAELVLTDETSLGAEAHLLDDKLGSGGFFKEHKLYQAPGGAGILFVGTDEEGNIVYDENGEIKDAMAPAEMVAYDREVGKKEDFETEIVNRVNTYALNINNNPSAVSQVVSQVHVDIEDDIDAMSPKQVSDYLDQYGGDTKFDYGTKQEAEESIMQYNNLTKEIFELSSQIKTGEKLDGSDLSDEEKANMENRIGSLQNQLDKHKLFMFIEEGKNGAVIDYEVSQAHRTMMSELMTTDYYARIGSTTQAKLVSQGRTEEEKKYAGYAHSISQGVQSLASASTNAELSQAIGRLKSSMTGQISGLESLAFSVDEYSPLPLGDGTLKVSVLLNGTVHAFDISNESQANDLAKGLIDLGGAHSYRRTANEYEYSFDPVVGADPDFRGDKLPGTPIGPSQ